MLKDYYYFIHLFELRQIKLDWISTLGCESEGKMIQTPGIDLVTF